MATAHNRYNEAVVDDTVVKAAFYVKDENGVDIVVDHCPLSHVHAENHCSVLQLTQTGVLRRLNYNLATHECDTLFRGSLLVVMTRLPFTHNDVPGTCAFASSIHNRVRLVATNRTVHHVDVVTTHHGYHTTGKRVLLHLPEIPDGMYTLRIDDEDVQKMRILRAPAPTCVVVTCGSPMDVAALGTVLGASKTPKLTAVEGGEVYHVAFQSRRECSRVYATFEREHEELQTHRCTEGRRHFSKPQSSVAIEGGSASTAARGDEEPKGTDTDVHNTCTKSTQHHVVNMLTCFNVLVHQEIVYADSS